MILDDVKNSSLSSDVKKSNRKVSFIRFIKIWNDLQQWNVPDIHKEMAKWLSNLYNSKNKKGLLLAFRGSGKSSIAGLFAAWVLYKQNDCRVLIVSADKIIIISAIKSKWGEFPFEAKSSTIRLPVFSVKRSCTSGNL